MWFTCQPLLVSIPVIMRYPLSAMQASPGGQCMAPELTRQLDDILCQAFFARHATRDLALPGAMLPEDAAGPALRYTEGLPHMINASTATRRA